MVLSSFCARKGHLPPVSMPRATSRHRRLWRNSGYVHVCILLSVSGFTQCCSCVLPALRRGCPSRVEGDHGGIVQNAPNWKAVCDHFNAAIVLPVDVSRVVL